MTNPLTVLETAGWDAALDPASGALMMGGGAENKVQAALFQGGAKALEGSGKGVGACFQSLADHAEADAVLLAQDRRPELLARAQPTAEDVAADRGVDLEN